MEWDYSGYVLDTTTERVRALLGAPVDLPEPAELRSLREAAGLSQQNLADAMGVTRAAVSHWETGTRSPRGELRYRYMSAISVLRESA